MHGLTLFIGLTLFNVSVNGMVCWDRAHIEPSWPIRPRVEFTILAPSGWLMARSLPVRHFYDWEYRAAGGLNATIPGY